MSKFKVGDRVRFIGKEFGGTRQFGRLGVVKDIRRDTATVPMLDVLFDGTDETEGWYDYRFELVEERFELVEERCAHGTVLSLSCEQCEDDARSRDLSPRDLLTYKERKEMPLCEGLIDYFPDACLYVSRVSFIANEQHNPGEPMHWAKEKSIGKGNEIARHLIDRGKLDTDNLRHTGKLAWRAMELLQRELEAATARGEKW